MRFSTALLLSPGLSLLLSPALSLLLLAALSVAPGCAARRDTAAYEGVSFAAPASLAADTDERQQEPAGRLIIRTAFIAVLVDQRDAAVSKIEARVAELRGHVTSSTIDKESASLSVRVPSPQLDAFLDEVAALGEETGRTVTGTDITDAYSDTEAEIRNLTSLRDRLRALLERANKVEEILQVERELNRVQTQLDSLSARKQRMTTDLQLSEVSVSVAGRPPKRILGPLGLLYEGMKWVAIKLFVISP